MPDHAATLSYDATQRGDALMQNEFLLTNGTGAFAAGTALGVNTRRYHGLLIAATQPPVGRVNLLNQCFEQLVLGADYADRKATEQVVELSSLMFTSHDNQPLLVPEGNRQLASFHKGLSATWVYAWGGVRVTRELFLHWKQQAITLRYTVEGLDTLPEDACSRATLRVSPMLTLRDFHGTLKQDWAGPFDVQPKSGPTGPAVTVTRDGISATFAASGGQFANTPDWWHNVHYPIDQRRGQDAWEDHFLPGRFEFPVDLQGQTQVTLTAALGDTGVAPNANTDERAAHLAPAIAALAQKASDTFSAASDPPPLREGSGEGVGPASSSAGATPEAKKVSDAFFEVAPILAQAADDFVVDRTVRGQSLSTILAGYPWFADWGRDTFIALPGCLLSTGRFDEARATLRAFAEAIGTGEYEGLVPNRFDDYDEAAAHYNTVDGSLWFVHAAMEYLAASGDTKSWNNWLAQACVRIVDAYAHGTGYGIHMDADGLISAGDWHTQLTWMDAAAVPPGGDELHVFTPRPGKCVEINALWYNALAGLADLLPDAMNDTKARYADLAKQAKRAFTPTFWHEEFGCLFDFVTRHDDGSEFKDGSIRPNQCFAVSLPRSPLDKAKQQSVMDVVARKLQTPAGLRTLAVDHPDFCPWYGGPQYDRDRAYHQGTVWPWLIGPFAEGLLRAGDFTPAAQAAAAEAIAPLLDFLQHRGVGQLYEIHQAQVVEAKLPPRGCFAQAWSVAEVLRVWGMVRSS